MISNAGPIRDQGEKMRLLLIFFAALVWLPSVSAQTGKPMSIAELAAYNKPDREQVLIEGAKKEGRLMWYTSLTGGPNQEVPKAFEAKFPGIKVDVYRGDSDAIIQRVLQEAQAKRFLVDTIETTFPVLKVMQEYKLLAPYFSPHLGQYPDEAKPTKVWSTGLPIASRTSVSPTIPTLCRGTRSRRVSTICSILSSKAKSDSPPRILERG